MSDEVFHDVAYKAKKRDHLLAGLDEFLDAVTVLPPGEWDPSIRIEPPSKVSFIIIHLLDDHNFLARFLHKNQENIQMKKLKKLMKRRKKRKLEKDPV